MTYSLEGQVIIVTGASSGIGEALCRVLAQEGARIALAARHEKKLVEVAEQVQALGGEPLIVATDVTDADQVDALIYRVCEHWGRVDILVANAGTYTQMPTGEMTVKALEQTMEVNYIGAMRTVLAVLPIMQRQGQGHLVLMSSQAAFIPIPPDGPYVASKAALAGIAQVMRQELADSNIDVTVIHPGRIDTPMLDHLRMPWISPKVEPEKLARQIVLGIRKRRRRVVYPYTGYLYLVREIWPAFGDWLIRALHLQGWSDSSSKAG